MMRWLSSVAVSAILALTFTSQACAVTSILTFDEFGFIAAALDGTQIPNLYSGVTITGGFVITKKNANIWGGDPPTPPDFVFTNGFDPNKATLGSITFAFSGATSSVGAYVGAELIVGTDVTESIYNNTTLIDQITEKIVAENQFISLSGTGITSAVFNSFTEDFPGDTDFALDNITIEGDTALTYVGPEFNAPEPPALPLFASGLALMGWFAWRKRNENG
jgi:hypothetical protein